MTYPSDWSSNNGANVPLQIVARVAAVLLAVIPLVSCDRASLSDADVTAVRALSDRYAAAWIAGDTAGVLSVFADDAVLLPARGAPQSKGKSAIRAFFWPPSGPPTPVIAFVRTSAEVAGRGPIAWDRGTYELAFVSEGDTVRSAGNYLAVSERNPDGEWRWAAYAWSSR